MPIDPSIPLSGRPAQFQDMGQTLGQLFQFRAMKQQQDENDYKIQAQRRSFESDRAVRGAMQKHAGDMDAALDELEQTGFGPEAFKAREQLIEQRQKAAAAVKTQTEAQRLRFEQASNIVHGMTPDNFSISKRAIGSLVGEDLAGWLGDTYDKTKIEQAKTWGRTTTDQITADRDAASSAHQALVLEQAARRDAQTFQQEQPKIVAEWTNAAAKSLGNAQSPEDWQGRRQVLEQGGPLAKMALQQFDAEFSPEAKQRAMALGISAEKGAELKGQAAGQAETKRHNIAGEAADRERNTRENKKFEATYGAGVDEQGKPLPESPTAKAIAEYRIPPPSSRSLASGPGMALMGQVMKINPDYRGEEFPTRAKIRAAFTSGPQSQTINSLNTAVEHLDQFVDAAKALGNGNFQPGNSAYNALRTIFGDSTPTNFEGIKTIMSGELASAFKKSGATDEEIKSVKSAIESKGSTAQLVDYATKIAIPALGSKSATFKDQYQAVMGEKDPWSPLSKNARGVLTKYGYDPDRPTMGGPQAPVAAPTGTVQMTDGKDTYNVPADRVTEALARGLKRK